MTERDRIIDRLIREARHILAHDSDDTRDEAAIWESAKLREKFDAILPAKLGMTGT